MTTMMTGAPVSNMSNDDRYEHIQEGKMEKLSASEDNFAQSLCRQFAERGSLSPKQWYHVDVLLATLENPVPSELDCDKLHGLMTSAQQKYPKIRMNTEHGKLVISRAGGKSRFPGSLNLTDGRPFGENVWYGRVVEGIFQVARNCPLWVVEIVRALEENPEKTAADYGKKTGNCCFCGRDLEDERSTSVGYGPICAGKWGMAWGSVEVDVEAETQEAIESMGMPEEQPHDCWDNAVPYTSDGPLGHGFECGRCGAFLQAG